MIRTVVFLVTTVAAVTLCAVLRSAEPATDDQDRTVLREMVPDFAFLEEALDAVIPKFLQEGRIPGAVVAVGRLETGGYRSFKKAYGYRQTTPHQVPMTEDAIFDMASLTKPIATGTSLMMLVEQHRLELDDPVGKFLPEFTQKDRADVTVRQLMTHWSGEPPYLGSADQQQLREEFGFPCPEPTRTRIRSLKLARPCGERFVYSCLNAILCAEIVEETTGVPIDQYAAEHIFKPLGMADTGFNPSADRRGRCVPTTQAAHGAGKDGFLVGQVHDPLAALQGGVSGNAGLFSTAADLERFAQMLLGGGELEGTRILKQETVREMARAQFPDRTNAKGRPDRRALLWDTYPAGAEQGIDGFGHTGYTGTAMRIYPDRGIYVVLLTNRVHPDDSAAVGPLRAAVWETVRDVMMGVGHGQ